MHATIKESHGEITGRIGRTLLRVTVAYVTLALLLFASFLLARHHVARVMLSDAAHTIHRTPFGPIPLTEDEEVLRLNRQFLAGMIVITCGFLALSRLLSKGEKSRFVIVTHLIAIGLFVELSIRAFADVDISADSWGYHLPFAARLSGIIGKNVYGFNYNTEANYDGSPHIFEFIQGIFWRITGRVQAANLVCLLSLAVFCIIMQRIAKSRWEYALLALITVPLVQIHATSDYVDLPVNLCVSILMIIVYMWFVEGRKVNNLEFIVSLLAATCAANGKFVMVPLSILLFSVIFYARFEESVGFRKVLTSPGRSVTVLTLGAACIVLISLTIVKNAIEYGDPLFPLQIKMFGITLGSGGINDPVYKVIVSTQSAGIAGNIARWVSSVLELKNQAFSWSIDQWSSRATTRLMGGFFGAFMAANLLLVVAKVIFKPSGKPWRERCFWLSFIFFTAILPRSSDLRYYMYFAIVLVTLNLHWISGMKRPGESVCRAERMWMSAVLAFLVVVLAGTRLTYVRPHFYGMQRFLIDQVDPRALAELKGGGSYTIDNAWWPFLYCAKFHQRGNYGLRDIRSADGPPTGPVQIRAVGSITHGGKSIAVTAAN